MSTIVTATDAAQFLSLVPSLLGCTPTRSLVVVPLARGRTLGAMRVDLPPAEAEDIVAGTLLGMVCRITDVDAMILVIYTDARIGGDRSLPHRDLAGAIGRRADACGLTVTDVLTVAADGWGSHLDPDLPAGGHPLGILQARPPVAPVSGDQASGARLPRCDAATRIQTSQALAALTAALQAICGMPPEPPSEERVDPAALQAACALDDLPALFEQALEWELTASGLPAMRVALLAWLLSRPSLRDVGLVQWATDLDGGDIAMEAQRRWEDGEEYPADLAGAMWGEGPRPDPERLEAALDLVRHVAARCPKKHRVGALAMAAWLSWALGRSTHADRYARMALRIEPGHGLSEIVVSFVQAGHLPDWAFRRG